ncbi:MAG: hypothetical protein RR854_00075 [Muribaculaceae bacterium]
MIRTKKIQIIIDETDKDKKKEYLNQVYSWVYECRKLANIISTHRFCQDKISDFLYLTEGVKKKLADASKNEDGIFTCSNQNTTYVVSKSFNLPSAIRSSLNQIVSLTYNKEKTEYFSGKRSLRSYKNNIPVPFVGTSLKFEEVSRTSESGNTFKSYTFILFKVPFICFFGKDRGFIRGLVEKVSNGSYKACGSSIQIDNGKIFLLLAVDIPDENYDLDEKKVCYAFLSVSTPITAVIGDKVIEIGDKDEFLYRRVQIQQARSRLQRSLRYTNGNGSRKNKLSALDRFSDAEHDYCETRSHQYSKALVNICIRNRCGTILLVGQDGREDYAWSKENEGEHFLLRNWGFHCLKEKITYKSKSVGINVESEKWVEK